MKTETALVTLVVGYALLTCFVYVQVYNYLYKKYGNRVRNGKSLFDTSTARETFISMMDMGIIMIFVMGAFRGGCYVATNVSSNKCKQLKRK